MHELAKIAMRGPIQAIALACITMLIPMMFWFGAAVVALVTLRKGFHQGAFVFFWTTLPAMVWLFSAQNPSLLLVLVLSFLMANILRITMSWQITLLAGGVTSILLGWLTPYIWPELVESLTHFADDFFNELAKNSDQENAGEMKVVFESSIIPGFASSIYGLAIVIMCLARSWQAKLFNPGGWQEEFHKIRVQPHIYLVLLILLLVSSSLKLNTDVIEFNLMIGLFFCGIALVHGLIAKKKMNIQWLIGFYIATIFLFPISVLLIVLLTIIDSFIDFRKRLITD